MDPNANLQEQDKLLDQHLHTQLLNRHDRERLRELREALVDWIARGGFQPDWAAYPHAAKYYGR